MHGHLPHPATSNSDAAHLVKRGPKRGSYSCGRCGLPKRGHKCHLISNAGEFSTPVSDTSAVDASSSAGISLDAATDALPSCVVRPNLTGARRRALSFDDVSAAEDELEEGVDPDLDLDLEGGGLPSSILWEVLKRLPLAGLFSVARVCKSWRQTTKKFWRAAVELRFSVPPMAEIGFVGSVLQKCLGLEKLSLTLKSDFDATMLACIAFSCPNLQSMDISTSDSSVNRISGDELGRFIAEKRFLTSLKMEGCSNLFGLMFFSSSLSTLCLSDLQSLSKMVFNCPNLKEISLVFSRQGNDNTDITSIMDSMGRSCPKLENIHVASFQLSHAAVLALTAANLRGLKMLSLVFGSEITDASVAAITSSFLNLELLDLSGSSISDSGIGMICNVFPDTLSKLLLALCPNITSSGIQFAAAQLPRLEVLDCGRSLCHPESEKSSAAEGNAFELQKTPSSKFHLIYQKLIIKHSRLKKLSLWGCSSLDALYLNCPSLRDLNLNSCRNLHPERLLLQCQSLENVHALDCQRQLVQTIVTQVQRDFSNTENLSPSKRLPDGSKRIQVPYFCSPQPSEDEMVKPKAAKRQCTVISA